MSVLVCPPRADLYNADQRRDRGGGGELEEAQKSLFSSRQTFMYLF